ncbi:MAG TPA: hypothetical protein VGP77_16035 [Vicinamibacterales bacterium]|jgi:hypothetical protein|nr:hypothetical protein [Vicinamibacterales bacterium]
MICNHEWQASRVEVDSVPVRHICAEPLGHDGDWPVVYSPHRCSCGATT